MSAAAGTSATFRGNLNAQDPKRGYLFLAGSTGRQLGRPTAFTSSQRAEIKSALEGGHKVAPLAKRFDVSRQTIMRIRDEVHKTKVRALQDVLLVGEQSGEPRPFDFEAFKDKKRRGHEDSSEGR